MVNKLNLSFCFFLIHPSALLATSGSDNETAAYRRRLGKVAESRLESDNNTLTSPLPASGHVYQSGTLEQDDNTSKPIASSIPRKLANDLSQVKLNSPIKNATKKNNSSIFSLQNEEKVLVLVNQINPQKFS
jgi:hypothetical protein